jgi:Major intrinsic protein
MPAVPLARALVAEAIGTFALVFAGAGAVMVDAKTHALGHVGVAITFGLVIMAMIYAVGHISGRTSTPPSPSRSRSPATSRGRVPRVIGWRSLSAPSPRQRFCAARSATSPTSARHCPRVRRASRFCGSS